MLTLPLLEQRLLAHTPNALDAKHYAAVAIIVVNALDPELLLIRRAIHPGDPWSGQMAFPGGRREPTDADLLETARREAFEEVGVSLERARTLGRLDDIPAVSAGRPIDMVIRPYVFSLDQRPKVALDPDEVASVVWARANLLATGAAKDTYLLEHGGITRSMPAFDVNGHKVWGLTYRMLSSLLEVAQAER